MAFEDNIVGVAPFEGTVNILFRGAVLASSERALKATDRQGGAFCFLPFQDVHFELLERSETIREAEAGGGIFWDVVAVGERIPAAVLAYENPPPAHDELMAHVAFLSEDLVIDVVAAAEKAERVADWPR